VVRVRAVILGFLSADTLPAAVESLLAQEVLHRHTPGGHPSVELDLVVVLNGASQQVRAVAAALPEPVRLVSSDTNLGFAGGCNLGARSAPGEPAPDFLVFFNDDAVADPGWLAELLDFATGHPAAAIVGSRLRFPDGQVQDAGGILLRDGYPAMVGRGWAADDDRIDFARRVDYVSGAAILVRNDAFAAVGGFDDGYFPAYYEDADLCLRLAERGWETWYLPTAGVAHSESASSAEGRKARIADRNERRFLRRWQHLLPSRVPRGRADDHRIFLAAQARRGGHRRVLVDSSVPGAAELAVGLAVAGARVDLLSAAVRDVTDRHRLARAGVQVITDRTAEHRRPTGIADLVLAGPGADRALLAALRPDAVVVHAGHDRSTDPIAMIDGLLRTGRQGVAALSPPSPRPAENTVTSKIPTQSSGECSNDSASGPSADSSSEPKTDTHTTDRTVEYLTDALGLREAELLIARARVRELLDELSAVRHGSSAG